MESHGKLLEFCHSNTILVKQRKDIRDFEIQSLYLTFETAVDKMISPQRQFSTCRNKSSLTEAKLKHLFFAKVDDTSLVENGTQFVSLNCFLSAFSFFTLTVTQFITSIFQTE